MTVHAGGGADDVRRRDAGHRHDPLDIEEGGELDRLPDVVPVLVADLRVRMQGVAVAVERRGRHPGRAEQLEVLVAGVLASRTSLIGRWTAGRKPPELISALSSP